MSHNNQAVSATSSETTPHSNGTTSNGISFETTPPATPPAQAGPPVFDVEKLMRTAKWPRPKMAGLLFSSANFPPTTRIYLDSDDDDDDSVSSEPPVLQPYWMESGEE